MEDNPREASWRRSPGGGGLEKESIVGVLEEESYKIGPGGGGLGIIYRDKLEFSGVIWRHPVSQRSLKRILS